MLDILDNKESFKKLKPHKISYLIIILLSLIIGIIIFMSSTKMYDNYQTKGYVTCEEECTIISALPTDIPLEKINLNNKLINYEIISKDLKINEDNFISYYELNLKCNKTLNDKEIVTLNFYYNKQRIFTKMLKIIF